MAAQQNAPYPGITVHDHCLEQGLPELASETKIGPCNYHREGTTFVDSIETVRMAVQEGEVSAPRVEPSQPLRNECSHFLDCVLDGTRSRSGPREGFEVVAVLEAISRSLEKRGAEVEVAS